MNRVRAQQTPQGPRLCVCQAPNAFTCVSGVVLLKHQMRLYGVTKCVYMCVTKCVYMCVTKCVCMCVTKCVYMCVTNSQRSSFRSLTFARFVRTFF